MRESQTVAAKAAQPRVAPALPPVRVGEGVQGRTRQGEEVMDDALIEIRNACQFAANEAEELRNEGARDWDSMENTFCNLFAIVVERAQHTQNAVRGLALLCRALAHKWEEK